MERSTHSKKAPCIGIHWEERQTRKNHGQTRRLSHENAKKPDDIKHSPTSLYAMRPESGKSDARLIYPKRPLPKITCYE